MRLPEGRSRPAWIASLAIHGVLVAAVAWWLADRLDRDAAPAAPTPLKLAMFQAPEPAPPEPVQEPVQEEPVQEEPVQEPPPPQAIPEPAPEPPPPLPVERPKPVQVKPRPSPPKVAPPRPVEPIPAPAEATQPPVQASAPPAAMPAAPAPAAEPMPPAPDPALEADYRDRIRQAVDAHKHYPRMARRMGVEGRVMLAFTIRADGRLAGVRVAESSGSEVLDEAALQAVRDAAPFPPFPESIGRERWDFTLPLTFALGL